MLEEETWSDDNYHDFYMEDAAFPPKVNLSASSMPHHTMLLDPGPPLNVDDQRRLEFKIAKKELQVLNKRRALQLSHSGIEVQPSAVSSADLVGGLCSHGTDLKARRRQVLKQQEMEVHEKELAGMKRYTCNVDMMGHPYGHCELRASKDIPMT
jgi:hypothetical protein